jgi:hypothetical protein
MQPKEKRMSREVLERPFPEGLIKKRRGVGGKTLSYVDGAQFIRRLNEAFEGAWSFEIVEHLEFSNEVVVLGKLKAQGVTKMAFGGASITSNSNGVALSIADDLKAAATDALKKASSLLGVGLHLYSDTPAEPETTDRTPEPPHNGPRSSWPRDRTPGRRPNGDGRLTQKQLGAIWSMGRVLGVSSEEIRRRSVEVFGVTPEQLTKADASTFISDMKAALAGSPGAERGDR